MMTCLWCSSEWREPRELGLSVSIPATDQTITDQPDQSIVDDNARECPQKRSVREIKKVSENS